MAQTPLFYALDLGSSSIKCVSCRPSRTGPKIIDARMIPLPSEFPMLSDEQEKIRGWQEALHTLLKAEKNSAQAEVAVSLPNDSTIVRYITLPDITHAKLGKIIRFEAEQQIPILFSDVEWGYAEIPPRSKKEVDVVIAAAKKQLLSGVMDVLSQYNLTITAFEAGQVVLNSFARYHDISEGGTILVDLGASSVHVILLYKGMCWGRTLHFGMFKITSMIAEKMHCTIQEAEEMKKKAFHAHTETDSVTGALMHRVIEEVLYEVANEISRTISYYLSLMRGAVFSSVVLTGGGAAIPGIAPFFEKSLGIKTQVMDFSSRCDIPAHLKEHMKKAHMCYTTALGMCASVQFPQRLSAAIMPAALKENQVQKVKQSRFNFFLGITVLILMTVFINFTYLYSLKVKQERLLAHYVDALTIHEREYDRIVAPLDTARAQLEIVAACEEERIFFADLMRMIQSVISEEVWFDSFVFKRKERLLELSGRTTGTLADINALKNALQQVPFIKTVTVDAASIDEETQEMKPVRLFSMTVQCTAASLAL